MLTYTASQPLQTGRPGLDNTTVTWTADDPHNDGRIAHTYENAYSSCESDG